jgi:hypothetical protein
MLSEHQQELMVERLVNRIEQLDDYILSTIGNRVKQIGTLKATQVYQIQQMLKYGKDIDSIKKYITKVTALNLKDIEKIFEEEAKINQEFAKQFYIARGMKFIPYAENLTLQNQVRAIANITMQEYANLSRTLGFKTINGFTDLSRVYQDTIDRAILSVSQGKETYQQAMRSTLQELGESGIRCVDYASGYHKRLDSAVRMNLMDGMRNLSNELQKQFGAEYGADGIEISVHENPAPDHEDIQGKQYSIEEFNQLNDELERPISTMNCYHYTFSIVLGVSKPLYTKKQLEQIKKDNHKGFEIDGKHYTMYEGTQLQRKLETEIRKQKDIQIIGKSAGDKEIVSKSQTKITQLNKKYKELSKLSGLPMKKERLSVTGYNRINVAKM